jgi:hypothetical protein
MRLVLPENALFVSLFYIKTSNVPRQARDKHGKT